MNDSTEKNVSSAVQMCCLLQLQQQITAKAYLKKRSLKLRKSKGALRRGCVHGLRNVGYTERLNRLGLPTLELRGLQLDLIFCYKILITFSLAATKTPGVTLTLV